MSSRKYSVQISFFNSLLKRNIIFLFKISKFFFTNIQVSENHLPLFFSSDSNHRTGLLDHFFPFAIQALNTLRLNSSHFFWGYCPLPVCLLDTQQHRCVWDTPSCFAETICVRINLHINYGKIRQVYILLYGKLISAECAFLEKEKKEWFEVCIYIYIYKSGKTRKRNG